MHDIYDGYLFVLDMFSLLYSHIAFFLDDSLWGAVLAAGLTDEIKADTSDLVEFFLSAREAHFVKSVHMVCVNI